MAGWWLEKSFSLALRYRERKMRPAKAAVE